MPAAGALRQGSSDLGSVQYVCTCYYPTDGGVMGNKLHRDTAARLCWNREIFEYWCSMYASDIVMWMAGSVTDDVCRMYVQSIIIQIWGGVP